MEELQSAEDKVSHLNMVKTKLEQTMDDLEGTLDYPPRGSSQWTDGGFAEGEASEPLSADEDSADAQDDPAGPGDRRA